MDRRKVLNLGAERWRSCRAVLLAAAGCTLVLALTGYSRPSAMPGALAKEPTTSADSPAAVPPPGGSTYTLLQMNLCLSGVAGCYPKVAYPAGVEEAVTRIRDAHPDAVTFNEACHGDVARIARRPATTCGSRR